MLWLIVLCRAEPVLLAAGERVAKQLPAAMRADDMEWADVGKAEEEDAFLVEWKAEVRRMSDEIHNHPSECVQSNLRRHCLPQMCALLQPLRDNMVQCSSFVQVSPRLRQRGNVDNHSLARRITVLLRIDIHVLISNTSLIAFCNMYVHINLPS